MTALRRAVSGAVAIVAILGAASPAQAHPSKPVVTSPTGAQDRTPGTVDATVTRGDSVLKSASLRLEQVGTTRPVITATTAPSGSMKFPVSLPYNGTYRATVTVTWEDAPLGVVIDSGSTTSDAQTFTVAAPPARPTDVKTAVDAASRAVEVTWKANTEPDLLFYVVQRAKGTSTDFAVVGKSTEARFTDATTAEGGGEYRYQVVAVRKGITEGEGVSSDPSALSAESTATVPDPPPPSTAAPAAGAAAPADAAAPGAAPGAGSTSTVPASSPGALTTSGKVDLTGFTNVQSQARPRTAPTKVERDTGFQSTLPFASTIPEEMEEEGELEEGGELGELAADSPQFRELGADEEGADRQETMFFLAAGLLATVLLMHVLWVKSEVKRVPLEAVAPEGPLPVVGRRGQALPATGKQSRSERRRAAVAARPPKAPKAPTAALTTKPGKVKGPKVTPPDPVDPEFHPFHPFHPNAGGAADPPARPRAERTRRQKVTSPS